MRALLIVCGLALLTAARAVPAQADPPLNVRSAFLRTVDNAYVLSARVELPIDAHLRETIEDGVPIKVGFEMEVTRARNYWPDKTVATFARQYELRYHAVSDRYLVHDLGSGEQTTFPVLDAALEFLTHLDSVPAFDKALAPKGRDYEARLRVSFDVGEMPAALRWAMFWSDRYRVSEWYLWALPPQ